MILPDGTFLATNWDWILAIVFLVITVRIILFPIFVKQIRSQRAMQATAAEDEGAAGEAQGRPGDAPKEMMKLYQTEKVNPLMGCLPMFLQIPVFLGLFRVLSAPRPVSDHEHDLYGWTQRQWDGGEGRPALRRSDRRPSSRRRRPISPRSNADGVVVKVVAGDPRPDHDGHDLPDQPADDPQDRLVGRTRSSG